MCLSAKMANMRHQYNNKNTQTISNAP